MNCDWQHLLGCLVFWWKTPLLDRSEPGLWIAQGELPGHPLIFFKLNKYKRKAVPVVQQLEAVVHMPEDLSSIPRSLKVAGKNLRLIVVP